MAPEQEERLLNALENLYHSEEYKELRSCVQELTDTGLDNPSIERAIDETLICQGAWIYDTIKGRSRGKTLVQKIRKTLGYTYP